MCLLLLLQLAHERCAARALSSQLLLRICQLLRCRRMLPVQLLPQLRGSRLGSNAHALLLRQLLPQLRQLCSLLVQLLLQAPRSRLLVPEQLCCRVGRCLLRRQLLLQVGRRLLRRLPLRLLRLQLTEQCCLPAACGTQLARGRIQLLLQALALLARCRQL